MASDVSSHRRLSLLIGVSLLIFAAAVVLRVGLGLTDYRTTDSLGRTMGFNDPLSWEHYGIMVRTFRPAALLDSEHLYDWVLLAMHLVGIALLWSPTTTLSRWTRWFFALQPLLFPLGLFFLPFFPLAALMSVGATDREHFVDMPFIIMLTQPAWLLVCGLILLGLRGQSLDVVRVWNALREGTQAGARSFAQAMR